MMPLRSRFLVVDILPGRVRGRVIAGGATHCPPIYDSGDNGRDVPQTEIDWGRQDPASDICSALIQGNGRFPDRPGEQVGKSAHTRRDIVEISV
jgi:hypothetical protein